jgi:hypothetical protein
MTKLYLLAALVLTLTGCDTLAKKRLLGIYHYVGQTYPVPLISKFELTDSKFIMSSLVSEGATDYVVEDGYVYVGTDASQIRFKIVSPDTLRNEGTMGFEGTYVKVK